MPFSSLISKNQISVSELLTNDSERRLDIFPYCWEIFVTVWGIQHISPVLFQVKLL